ncbi:MAG: LiaF domain-containing protein [bacterium]
MSYNAGSKGRLFVGLVLILLGGLFLLDNFEMISFYIPQFILNHLGAWFFIGIGIIVFAISGNKILSVLFILWGGFLIYPEFWPLLLVILGLFLIFKRGKPHGRFHKEIKIGGEEKQFSEDYIEDVSIFGGGNKTYSSKNFKGGEITSIFGGSEIDLRNCTLAPGTNTIDMTAIFGGSSLVLPRDWTVRIEIVPIFGGFADKRIRTPEAPDEDRVLVIKGVVIFGGGEIKN